MMLSTLVASQSATLVVVSQSVHSWSRRQQQQLVRGSITFRVVAVTLRATTSLCTYAQIGIGWNRTDKVQYYK